MSNPRPDHTSPNTPTPEAPLPFPIETTIEHRPGRLAGPGGMALQARAGFVIVNSFTSFNLMIGVLSLIVAGAGHTALAAWGLLLCVLLDSCDGSLARRWQVTSEFGAQLDSLADMTSFIIASVALTYGWAQPTTPFPLLLTVCGLYALAGAFRLARFNSSPEDCGFFQGIPSTGGAALLAANYLVAPPPSAYGVIALVALLALLMISTLPYPKLATLRRSPRWVWLVILVGALISPQATVWAVSAGYIGLGPAIWLYRRSRSTK
jgi:CDP-diacylglycerol---serine O-phosphatidyltransferase